MTASTHSMLKTLKPDAKKSAADEQQKKRSHEEAVEAQKEREKKQAQLKPGQALGDALRASLTPSRGGPAKGM